MAKHGEEDLSHERAWSRLFYYSISRSLYIHASLRLDAISWLVVEWANASYYIGFWTMILIGFKLQKLSQARLQTLPR
jgi:hypothetical protein